MKTNCVYCAKAETVTRYLDSSYPVLLFFFLYQKNCILSFVTQNVFYQLLHNIN